jgi:hypothetical protein
MGEMIGIDAAVFLSSGGGDGATVEAARGRLAAAPCAPGVGAGGGRRWLVGPCGGLGQPGGRGPVGEGRENRPVKKKKIGPKGRVGRK